MAGGASFRVLLCARAGIFGPTTKLKTRPKAPPSMNLRMGSHRRTHVKTNIKADVKSYTALSKPAVLPSNHNGANGSIGKIRGREASHPAFSAG
jgi:hypothetical protein